ncbi:hypothetical protein EJ02DRAFT_453687 [Clathrospora elynae]|uniref:Uncharacterized protein n=1 Tax=Clathrospora elynae TaxID=706981 RepID=A0A6A5SR92_9PLEO|nr:hypothetical protein EJ02DRAFT_453687 [Clathrospora elynae]
MVNRGALAELDSKEVASPRSPDVYRPSAKPHRRSVSVPMARILTYEPRSAISSGQASREVSMRSTSSPIHPPQEKKRQRRQTPFKVTTPSLTNAARHAPLEPLVAKHRHKASYDIISEMLPQIETEKVGEMGTFGVIQRYFDSQGGGPVPAPKVLCNACSPSTPNIPLPMSPELALSIPVVDRIAIYPIEEPNLPEEPPPTVPERSPKRLTNPAFPLPLKSTMSMNSEFAFAAEGHYSVYDKEDEVQDDYLHVPKKRAEKRLDVGQADRAGSFQVGRLAPPILSHDALTASADLGLNDLSYFLKHTGPSTEPQPATRLRKKKGLKMFKVKQRKSLAARVGSVEGSPQRARRQAPVPTCAREMTTSGGARHLKIIIPTESPRNTQTVSAPISQPKTQRRSRHVSINFTEEMLNPLGNSGVERMLSELSAPRRSFSEPVPVSPRSPKRAPKSSKAVPVEVHPLASREELTRARKLRDLQRVKRKPLATYHEEQHPDTVADALPTPAQTPEPLQDSSFDSVHDDEAIRDESSISKMAQMHERVVLLQRQNIELTEALAKIVGLELDDGELRGEDVLTAFRQVKFSRE